MIYLILTIAFLVRLVLAGQSLWLDEAASLIIANRPIETIFSYLSTDFHPPLFYLLLNLWLKLGIRAEWFLRLPNIAFGTLTIYFAYRLTEILFPASSLKIKQTKIPLSLITALLLALNPLHIYYSQELRMYSLSALLAIWSWFSLVVWTKQKKQPYPWQFTLISLANVYTFYGAIFNLFAQLVFIVFYRRHLLRKFSLSLLTIFIAFLPWVPTLKLQLQGSYFLKSLSGWTAISGELSFKSLFLIPAKFSLGRINFSTSRSFLLAGGVTTLYFVSLIILSLKHKSSRIFLIWLSIPILIAMVASYSSPMLGYWRYIYLIPAFVALIVLGLNQLPPKLMIINLVVIIFTLFSANLLFWLTPGFQREDWRSAVNFMVEQQSISDSPAIFSFADAFAPVLWYQPELDYVAPLKDLDTDPALLDLRLSQGTLGKSDLYYFRYLKDLTDPSGNISTWLLNAGYVVVDSKSFNNIGFIDHYQAQ